MKKTWKEIVDRISALLDRLSEDFSMDFIDERFDSMGTDLYSDLFEDGLFA